LTTAPQLQHEGAAYGDVLRATCDGDGRMEALPACFLVPCAFPDDCDNFPLTIIRPDLQLQKDQIIP